MSNDPSENTGSAGAAKPCPLCGGRQFTWGVAQGHYEFRFKPDNHSGFVEKYTVFGGHKVRARRCDACGNVQLVAYN